MDEDRAPTGGPPDGPPHGAGPTVVRALELESGTIAWAELVRHFARGVVLRLDGTRDLAETGARLAADDVSALEAWLEDGSVRRASDDDARDWVAREPTFRCVVVAPWVLVQELS